jgi:type IV pilus biogenesis protein CpaD/CtpE
MFHQWSSSPDKTLCILPGDSHLLTKGEEGVLNMVVAWLNAHSHSTQADQGQSPAEAAAKATHVGEELASTLTAAGAAQEREEEEKKKEEKGGTKDEAQPE